MWVMGVLVQEHGVIIGVLVQEHGVDNVVSAGLQMSRDFLYGLY